MLTYEKNGEITAVLSPREFFLGKASLSLLSGWVECRIGMFFSVVDDQFENAACPSEDVAVSGVNDYVFFGLKDSSPLTLPGEAGSLFLGVRSTGTTTRVVPASTSAGYVADSAVSVSAVGYNGVTLSNGGAMTDAAILFPDPAPIAGFNGFYCLRLMVSNAGSSTQSVGISISRSGSVAGDDYSVAALRQTILNALFSPGNSVPWNNGVVATQLPDSVWARFPFYNARLRVHSIMQITGND